MGCIVGASIIKRIDELKNELIEIDQSIAVSMDKAKEIESEIKKLELEAIYEFS